MDDLVYTLDEPSAIATRGTKAPTAMDVAMYKVFGTPLPYKFKRHKPTKKYPEGRQTIVLNPEYEKRYGANVLDEVFRDWEDVYDFDASQAALKEVLEEAKSRPLRRELTPEEKLVEA